MSDVTGMAAGRVQKPRRSWLRKAVWIGCSVAVLWAMGCAVIYAQMRKPPEEFGRFMKHVPGPVAFVAFPFESMWMRARRGGVEVGEQAPDFALPKIDKSAVVRLSEINREKPVVLIFGSYTWPPFRREVPALNKLYEQYQDKVAFLVVYITEAHPSDVWQMQSNIKDSVVYASPKNEAERAELAGACVRKLGIKIPAVVDEFGNSTEQTYTAWPDRIYVIDRNGRVAYKSKPGPFGFSAETLKQSLAKII